MTYPRLLRRGHLLGLLVVVATFPAAVRAGEPPPSVPFAPPSGPRGTTLFAVVAPGASGIVTENNYADAGSVKSGYKDPRMWADRYHEFEVGAVGTGIAIGDYDGDGRPDVFVVSKTESCRLFRNLGNWKFEDVTVKAGVEDKGDAAGVWKQGATFADVNNDGRLDIYVCRFGAPNLLYINQGDGTFKEEASPRGLAVNDASVMAAFCDYDRDGWLDVFVQTNLLDASTHPNGQKNYLFHNNGDGTFTDVTTRAGISGEGQGHSAVWWDYDGDGWPDLYVANDFAAPDKLYRNRGDGTFADVIDSVVPHMPESSMGSDLGDINNDGLIDLFASDMAATSHQKDFRTIANTRATLKEPPGSSPSAPQYPRNALYLNAGAGQMREAAFLAGVAATDWTWSVRLEDLDNDGRLDLFVTNGMHREVHNLDIIQRLLTAASPDERVRIERSAPVLVEQHFAFRNLGDLQFCDVSAAWGLNQKGVSFGAAFGDLDGDGDLDLIYSNYKSGVTVLRNDSDTGHSVIFALHGVRSNRFGVGATVRIETASGPQIRQLVLARGLLSSSEPTLHFGLGKDTLIKRAVITWPSGEKQVFESLAVDRTFTVTEPAVAAGSLPVESSVAADLAAVPQFSEVSQALGLALSSRENEVDELSQQPLLPARQNRRGPSLALGQFTSGAGEEIVFGGTPLDPLRILERTTGGGFRPISTPKLTTDSVLNDGPVLAFDANGDGFNDLIVSKGGVALPAGAPEYQPRLLLGDGAGGFKAAPEDALPPLPISVGALAAADFNHDGLLDLFMGGRVLPGQYPFSPHSALLRNRGDGRFEDVTDSIAPGLREVGMVTSALWTDVDGDGWVDLLLTVEWGPVRYFHNRQGSGFEDFTDRSGFGSAGTGWWTSIAAADFNGDGRIDYAVGNAGLNTPYQADAEHPALLYVGDFRGNGSSQLIEAFHEGDKVYPWRVRKDLSALPTVAKRFPKNDAYARATLEEIVGADKLAKAQRFAATQLSSGVFLSQPDGTYRFEPLPRIAQISVIQGMVAGDFDGDGFADLVAVQNTYAPIPSVGRFDGGLGQLLRGDGRGHFVAVPPHESGIRVSGDAKALVVCDFNDDGWADFIVSRNNNTTLAFKNGGVPGRHSMRVSLRGSHGNLAAIGARISIGYADKSVQTQEVYAGAGYMSQSSGSCFFGYRDENPAREVHVRWPSGVETRQVISPGSRSVEVVAGSDPAVR